MDNPNKSIDTTSDIPETAPGQVASAGQDGKAVKPELQSGERVFTIILFLVGLFFMIQSLILWGKMSEPKIASAAALPLICSGLWTILSLLELIGSFRKSSPLSAIKDMGQRIKAGLAYSFPHEVLIVMLAIVVYCATLLLGISFYIVTPLFLWGTMCYLTKKNFLLNILWTAICMGFIFVVFRMLFGVILP